MLQLSSQHSSAMKLLLSFTCVSVLLCLSVGAIPMADHEPLGLVSHEQEPDGMGGLVSQQAPLNQPVDGPITYPTDIEPPIADPDPIPPSNETHPADPSAHQSLVSQLSTIDILNTQFCHISASDQAAIRRDRDNPALVSRAVDPYIDSFTYQPCTFSPEAFCNGCHAANSSSGAEVIQSYFKTVGICEDRSPCGTQHRFCRFNASTYLLFNPAVMQDIYANGMVGDVFTGSAILDLEASLARHYVEKGVEQGLQFNRQPTFAFPTHETWIYETQGTAPRDNSHGIILRYTRLEISRTGDELRSDT